MKRLVLAALLLIGLSGPGVAQTCPTAQNATPQFTAGGSVFGRLAAQWNQYFGSKADANSGTLCNPVLVNPSFTPPIVGVTSCTACDATGRTDSTVALQNCLNSAGSGGVCSVDQDRLLILGNVTIPGNVTLSCGTSFPNDAEDAPAGFVAQPAIMLDGGHTFTAGGDGATVVNCLVYRNGMSFPPTDDSAFVGTAFNDGGFGGFTVRDSIVMGFDTAVYITGERPLIWHVYADGKGSTHAVIEVDNGNTDSGYLDLVKIQPLSTGNASCTASPRAGTGLRVNGIDYIGTVTSQSFLTADFEFKSLVLFDKLWADDIFSCAAPSNVGILLSPGGRIVGDQVNLNSTKTGIKFLGASPTIAASINSMFLNSIRGDCVVLGATDVNAGVVQINSLITNPGQMDCAGYVVDYLDTTGGSSLQLLGGQIINVGGPTPYIETNGYPVANQVNISPNIVTDASPPSSIFGTPTVGSCTGLGSGSCAFLAGNTRTNPFSGVIVLSPAGSPSATGIAVITWPVNIPTANGCQSTLQAGSVVWPLPASTVVVSGDATHTGFGWIANSNLTAGQNYRLNFSCDMQ